MTANEQLQIKNEKKKKIVEGEDISMFSTQATILCLAHIFSALALSGVCNGP